MKLSDYVFSFLSKKGVNAVFYLSGGGCMHLVDSLGNNTKIKAVSLLHEQAVSVACEAYANTTEKPAAALVTSGPGGTNAITGVLAAYLDSSPCFFVSGQVKTADLKSRYGVRALGSQEADIVSMVSHATKYAAMITDKNSIRYHLERAWYEMISGRRGPVWLDIPLDIQGTQINPDGLEGFTPEEEIQLVDVTAIIDALNRAKRPLIIAGNGLMGCKNTFFKLAEFLQIPIIPTWKAMDYIPNDHPLYAGRAGGMGDRHGNFTMQNADLILSLGSRLDYSITGYDRSKWAVKAKKIIVEIDLAEIAKLEGANDIMRVNANVSDVLTALLKRNDEIKIPDISDWKKQISEWKSKYPIISKEKHFTSPAKLTTYVFIDVLCKVLPEASFIAPCSSGTTAEIFFQGFTVKEGQQIRSNHGLGSMGFELPGAIGMCIASGEKDTICIAGDGGVQLNIQELAIIKGRNLPVKLFVINNNGYASIRNMQNNHFKGHYVGCDAESGVFLPKMNLLAKAYELPYFCSNALETLEDTIKSALEMEGAVICEIITDSECLVSPRTGTMISPDGSMISSPLENQFPFLTEEELQENMLI